MDAGQARTFKKDGVLACLFLIQTIPGESYANLQVYFCFGGKPSPPLAVGHWPDRRRKSARARSFRVLQMTGSKHYCTADTRYGARLVRQVSQAPCKQEESWGYDEEGIWVDKGCGGEFTLGHGENGGDPRGEGGGGTITCASDNGRRKVCPANTSNSVQLVRQRR